MRLKAENYNDVWLANPPENKYLDHHLRLKTSCADMDCMCKNLKIDFDRFKCEYCMAEDSFEGIGEHEVCELYE